MDKRINRLVFPLLIGCFLPAVAGTSATQLEAKPIVFSSVRQIAIPVESTCNGTASIERPEKSLLLEQRRLHLWRDQFYALFNDDVQAIFAKCDNNVSLFQEISSWGPKYNPGSVFDRKIKQKEIEIAKGLGAVCVIQSSQLVDCFNCFDPRYDITNRVIAELNAEYLANQSAVDKEYADRLIEARNALEKIKARC